MNSTPTPVYFDKSGYEQDYQTYESNLKAQQNAQRSGMFTAAVIISPPSKVDYFH